MTPGPHFLKKNRWSEIAFLTLVLVDRFGIYLLQLYAHVSNIDSLAGGIVLRKTYFGRSDSRRLWVHACDSEC